MRVSSPSYSSRRPSGLRAHFGSLFIVIGTCALLVLVIVLITGGFVIDTGPLHFSAHRRRWPLVVVLIAWTSAALLCRRRGLADGTASIGARLDRHAAAAAEDWEGADLRTRFPASRIAGLDWLPRADVGSETRVRLFDPADRGQPSIRVATDRFR